VKTLIWVQSAGNFGAREKIMSSLVHTAQPGGTPNIIGAAQDAGPLRQAATVLSGRSAASLLLAAVVAALLVAANQVVVSWTDGHLLLAWIAMWTVAFAVLALAASPARTASRRLGVAWQRWSVARRSAQQDDIMWKLAMTDARMLADISRAMSIDAAQDVRR
jgi:hypothetical protein